MPQQKTASPAKRSRGQFDALGLAQRGEVIEGTVEAERLPRILDRLALGVAFPILHYRITGAHDGAGRPALQIALEGSLPLVCQRCLRAFGWPVEQQTLLLLARDEEELARLDEEDREHEVIAATEPLDLLRLVEDELLLSMPYIPRCPETQCGGAPDGQGAS